MSQVDLKLLKKAEAEAHRTYSNDPMVIYEKLLLEGYIERGRTIKRLAKAASNYVILHPCYKHSACPCNQEKFMRLIEKADRLMDTKVKE